LDTRILLWGCSHEGSLAFAGAVGAPELESFLGFQNDSLDSEAFQAFLQARASSYGGESFRGNTPTIPFCTLGAVAPNSLLEESAKRPKLDSEATYPPPEDERTLCTSTVLSPKAEHVCVGGTFDYLHNGHRLLLTITAWIASTRLVVGVAGEQLLAKKSLRELMQSEHERTVHVHSFLRSIKPSLALHIVPISDPYGPAAVDPLLDTIVVSKETEKGGSACNVKRAENNLGPMQIVVIDLVAKATGSQHENRDVAVEDKMSSSEVRKSMLGHFRGGCPRGWCPNNPYVVGVTGGIASGKSTAVREVQSTFGASVIDCDKLTIKRMQKVVPPWPQLLEPYGRAF
jgi:phosphopantetheine adenylyltransferase